MHYRLGRLFDVAVARILEAYPHGSVATEAFLSQNDQNLSHSNFFIIIRNFFDLEMLMWLKF